MPTVRQLKAAEALVDGAPSIAAAARQAGFKEGYVRNGLLAGTKGFNDGIALAKAQRQDKASGILERTETLQRRVSRLLGKLEDADISKQLDPLGMTQLLAGLGEIKRRELEIRQRFDLDAKDQSVDLGRELYHERMRRWTRIVLEATRRSNGDAQALLERWIAVSRALVPPDLRV